MKYLLLLLFCSQLHATEIKSNKITLLIKALDLTTWTWNIREQRTKTENPLLMIMIKTKLKKISQISITDLAMDECRYEKWMSNEVAFIHFSGNTVSGNIITRIKEPCIVNYNHYSIEYIKFKVSIISNGIHYYRIFKIRSLDKKYFTKKFP